MVKEVNEIMTKQLKESMKTMTYQIENINKEIEIIKKKNQVEILELKSIITGVKILLEGLNSKAEQSEERIHQF